MCQLYEKLILFLLQKPVSDEKLALRLVKLAASMSTLVTLQIDLCAKL